MSLGLGYAVATRGTDWGLAVLAVYVVLGFAVATLHAPALRLAPVWTVLPLAGYLIVLFPGAGSSVVFDAVAVVPFVMTVATLTLRGKWSRLFRDGPLLVWLFVAAGLAQFVNPVAPAGTVSFHGFRQSILPALLFFVAYHLDVSAPGALRRLATLALSAGIPVALWAGKQRLVGLTGPESAYASEVGTFWVSGELRVFSTFATPWGVAAYFALLSLVAGGAFMAARSDVRRIVAASLAVLFAGALVMTHMRGPLLGFLVGLAFLATAWLGSRLGRSGAVTAFLAVLAMYAVFATFVGPRVLEQLAPDSVTGQRLSSILAPLREEGMLDRFTLWERVWPVAVDHPLGLGLGTTGGTSARFEDDLRLGAVHADNLYLALLLEVGWLGALAFVAVTAWVCWRGAKGVGRCCGGDERWIGLAFVAFIFAMSVAHLANPLLFERGAGQLFWVAAGVAANPTTFSRRRPAGGGRAADWKDSS